MRKILIVFGLLACLFFCVAHKSTVYSVDNKTISFLQKILPDSVYSFVKNKSFLLYTYGHYGCSWSILIREDSNIKAYSGRVDYSGNVYFAGQDKNNRFDSIAFFEENKSLIFWGLDTLRYDALKMLPVNDKAYTSIRETLYVINSDGEILFQPVDGVAFSESDDVDLNYKYNKLCLIMKWLAEPEIRKYLPDTLVF